MNLTKAQERALIEIARGNRTGREYNILTKEHLRKLGLIKPISFKTGLKLSVTDTGRTLANELNSPKRLSLIELLADHPKWLFEPEVEYWSAALRIFCITESNTNVYNVWYGFDYPVDCAKGLPAWHYRDNSTYRAEYNPTPRLPHITWELSLGKNGGVRGNATIWHDIEAQQGLTLTFGYIWHNGQSRIDILSTLPVPKTIEDAASFHQIYMNAEELEQPIGDLLHKYPGE